MLRIQIERERLGLDTRVHEETTGNTPERKDKFEQVTNALLEAIRFRRGQSKPPGGAA